MSPYDLVALVGIPTIITVVLSMGGLCLTVAIVGGFAWFFFSRVNLANKKAAEAKGWPSAPARVLKSFVEVSKGPRNVTHYAPMVIYEFLVNGQTYKANGIRYGLVARKGGYNGAQEVCDRYPEGSSLTIFYNPANPAEAVIER